MVLARSKSRIWVRVVVSGRLEAPYLFVYGAERYLDTKAYGSNEIKSIYGSKQIRLTFMDLRMFLFTVFGGGWHLFR